MSYKMFCLHLKREFMKLVLTVQCSDSGSKLILEIRIRTG